VEQKRKCGIEPGDVISSLVTNSDAGWSFGGGGPRFITGEL
jgi:hypothetical protein